MFETLRDYERQKKLGILPADHPASAPGRSEFTFEFYPADYFPTQTRIRAALADFLPRLTGEEVMTHGEV